VFAHNARMPAQPLTRDAGVAEFVHDLIKRRDELTYSFQYVTAVAHNEWSRKGRPDDPAIAAEQWNERSARP
jgi:hypothetical protein